MDTLKQEALAAISKLPESAEIDDIMYRIYVIDKVRKAKKSINDGDSLSIEDLKKEIESW
ncbi:hypothetical protein IIC38_07925 [candidate division KSB1 bacterium]|nr:hypothetical protein [candidate division KSB1 bacterium]